MLTNYAFVQLDKAVGIVSLALLTQMLSHHSFTQCAEIGSGMVAWATLPMLFRLSSRYHQFSSYTIKQDPSLPMTVSLRSTHLWLIAFGVCITSWFKSEIGVLQSFVRQASTLNEIYY